MNCPNGNGQKLLVAAAFAALASICAVSPAWCWSIEDLNPFGPSKYELKVEPNIPADRLYNEGLLRLENKDYENAAKTFRRCPEAISFFAMGAQGLADGGLRQLPRRQPIPKRPPLPTAIFSFIPPQPERPTSPISRARFCSGTCPTCIATRRTDPRAMKYFQTIMDKYPKSEYAHRRQVQDPGGPRPARRRAR